MLYTVAFVLVLDDEEALHRVRYIGALSPCRNWAETRFLHFSLIPCFDSNQSMRRVIWGFSPANLPATAPLRRRAACAAGGCADCGHAGCGLRSSLRRRCCCCCWIRAVGSLSSSRLCFRTRSLRSLKDLPGRSCFLMSVTPAVMASARGCPPV